MRREINFGRFREGSELDPEIARRATEAKLKSIADNATGKLLRASESSTAPESRTWTRDPETGARCGNACSG
jgi:hypothetical protein